MHFEEKILEKKHVYILVTKIYYWNIQRTWNGHQTVDMDRFTPWSIKQCLKKWIVLFCFCFNKKESYMKDWINQSLITQKLH